MKTEPIVIIQAVAWVTFCFMVAFVADVILRVPQE